MPRSPRPDPTDHHGLMHQGLRWQVDEHFNIAQVCARRWARSQPQEPAIIEHRAGQSARAYSYGQLQQAADALSAALKAMGVRRGDRVAIVLPQRFETAVAYMALLQMGAVAMPLSVLFGPEALVYRLQDSEAVAAIADAQAMPALQGLRASCPALRSLIGADGAGGDVDWARAWAAQHGRARAVRAVRTRADEAAVLIYTSGTTGAPKGALIPHRALIGNLTGFVCSQNWFGFDGLLNQHSQAVFWSPADWAWTGGLMDALLPTLYFGRPIVACAERFGAEMAFELMQQHGVSHTFLFPTALKVMMKAVPEPRARYHLCLQAIMSAGEAVGDAVFAWCRDQLGVTVNEMFGQTEINYIVGNCQRIVTADGKARPGWPARPGSMGKPYPGHRVAVIDEQGRECPVGVSGDVALHQLEGELGRESSLIADDAAAEVQRGQQRVHQAAGPGPVGRRPEHRVGRTAGLARVKAEPVLAADKAGEVADQRPVRDERTLGVASGAAGVDQHGRVVGAGAHRLEPLGHGTDRRVQVHICFGSRLPHPDHGAQTRAFGAGLRQRCPGRFVHDGDCSLAVLDAEREGVRAEQHGQRHGHSPHLQHRDVSHGGFKSLRQHDGHPVARLDTLGGQQMAQAVGGTLQLGIGPAASQPLSRHMLKNGRGLCGHGV